MDKGDLFTVEKASLSEDLHDIYDTGPLERHMKHQKQQRKIIQVMGSKNML